MLLAAPIGGPGGRVCEVVPLPAESGTPMGSPTRTPMIRRASSRLIAFFTVGLCSGLGGA